MYRAALPPPLPPHPEQQGITPSQRAKGQEGKCMKYPNVHVQLTGQNGNAFMVMGLTEKAMRRAGVPKHDIDAYVADATAGDFDHSLAVTMQTVDVL